MICQPRASNGAGSLKTSVGPSGYGVIHTWTTSSPDFTDAAGFGGGPVQRPQRGRGTVDADDDPRVFLIHAFSVRPGAFIAPRAKVPCSDPPGPSGVRLDRRWSGLGRSTLWRPGTNASTRVVQRREIVEGEGGHDARRTRRHAANERAPRDARTGRGEILEIHGPDGTVPFVVRWDDNGHTTLIFPGSEAIVEHHRPGGASHERDVPPPRLSTTTGGVRH